MSIYRELKPNESLDKLIKLMSFYNNNNQLKLSENIIDRFRINESIQPNIKIVDDDFVNAFSVLDIIIPLFKYKTKNELIEIKLFLKIQYQLLTNNTK